MDASTAKLLLWILCFKGVICPYTDAGERERQYSAEMSKILKETVLNKFIRLQDLETSYKRLNMSTTILNITDILNRKVSILERFFHEKEEIVKRVAQEAERLRNRTYPEDSSELEKSIAFSFESPPVNETPTIDSRTIPYHLSRCNCEESLIGGSIKPSQCFQSLSDYSVNNHFGEEKVSFTNTSVHLPVDVYEGGRLVLQDIYLSDGIDDVMKQEVCAEREFSHLTKWVYYATETGVMRYFPDRVWTSDCELMRMQYDSRITPWYINSMTSPKDVIILIDSSGSVKGPTYTALVWAIKELLKTLTPNDFMNVILFNKDVKFINSCENLFQATPRNKQVVLDLLELAEFRYETFYDPAFQKAFSILHGASEHPSSVTAKCNPTVLLFTDGDSSVPTEAMAKWNEAKNFRVFSFAIGETTFSKAETIDIACKNRGYYDTVPFFEARQRVRKYLDKLSQPLWAHAAKQPMWTLSYKDELGIGEVMSVSVPVFHGEFNESSAANANDEPQRVAGVVGSDISLEDLKKIVYNEEMTSDYYPFLIDNNGFAIIHPYLKKTIYHDVLAVDLSELEGEEVMNVRESIVNQDTGTSTLSRPVFFDEKRVLVSEYTYSFAPVKNTVFKLGIAVHESKLKQIDSYRALQQSHPSLRLNTLTNADDPGSKSDAFLYSSPCVIRSPGGYNPCAVNKTSVAGCPECFLEGMPLNDFDDANCDKTSYLYSNLLLHAYLSDEFSMSHWESSNTMVRDGDGALALFLAVDSPSFVRITYLNFTAQTRSSVTLNEELVKNDIKKILANPRNSTYFRRAAHKPQWTFYSYFPGGDQAGTEVLGATASTETGTEETTSFTQTTAVYSDSNTESSGGYVIASKAVQVLENDETLVSVVSGVVLDSDTFTRNLAGLDWKCDDKDNCDKTSWDLLCGTEEDIECLVADDGGHLISSNQGRHNKTLGQFLGIAEGDLMRRLIDMDVFKIYGMVDYQAYCPKSAQEKSAGKRMSPSITGILSLGWWLSSSVGMFLYSMFQSFVFGFWSVLNIGPSRILISEGAQAQEKMKMCVLRQPVVTFGANGQTAVYGEVECSTSCESKFNAIRVPDTNLIVIIVQMDRDACDDACHDTPPYTIAPENITNETMCRNNTTRYRQTPRNCYDTRNFNEAFDSPCSASLRLLPSHQVILALSALLNFILCRNGL